MHMVYYDVEYKQDGMFTVYSCQWTVYGTHMRSKQLCEFPASYFRHWAVWWFVSFSL